MGKRVWERGWGVLLESFVGSGWSLSRVARCLHLGCRPCSTLDISLPIFSLFSFLFSLFFPLRPCVFAPLRFLLRFRFFGSPLRSGKRVDPLHLAHFSFKV